MSAGYGTDNDSIKTEDFEHRFQSLIVLTDGNTSGESTRKTTSARNKRWKNSNSNGGGGGGQKGGLGNGPGAGSKEAGRGAGKAGNSGAAGGKVSFEDASKEKG